VWVQSRREGHDAVVRVRDDGVGMSPDLIPRVFEIFVQGDRSLDRSEGGLGIGLTMVDRLVTLHGGTVTARSDGPGKGSEFVVRLPLAGADSALPERESPTIKAKPRRLRVLVVDDNQDAGESMSLLLGMWGHDVTMAQDGATALEMAERARPEVVLLDIGLPGIDGYEVARRIRAKPGGENVVLVAMTGYGQAEDKQRAQEAGFALHLVKPIEPETLQRALARVDPRPRKA
jgi:CheY-like chemotaxis protein